MAVKLLAVVTGNDGVQREYDLDELLSQTDVTIKIIEPEMHKFSGIHLMPGETFPRAQKFKQSIEFWYTGSEK